MEYLERREKVIKAISTLQNYINTYSQIDGYEGYSDEIIISDILYGIGIAIDPIGYRYSEGFKKFKEYLINYLQENKWH